MTTKYEEAIKAYAEFSKSNLDRIEEKDEKGALLMKALLMKAVIEAAHEAGITADQVAYDITTALMKDSPFAGLWEKSMKSVLEKRRKEQDAEE